MINICFLSFGASLLFCFILDSIIRFPKYFISAKGRDFLDMGNHSIKNLTPSMGGLAFFALLPIMYKMFCKLGSLDSFFVILCAALSGIVGGIDDWLKLKDGKGLSVKIKFYLQMGAAFIPGIYYYIIFPGKYFINFFGYQIYIGIFIIFWITWVIMSTTHAVNLTDGIDGLAISQVIIIYFFISNMNKFYNSYFVNSLIIFFFLNKNKAKIFMGDIGAFFLGGFLAGTFLICKSELILPFCGIVFVCNTLTVIIQIVFLKIFKKRFFSFTPYHHALEKKGWSESKICIIFGILSFLINIIVYLFFSKFYV